MIWWSGRNYRKVEKLGLRTLNPLLDNYSSYNGDPGLEKRPWYVWKHHQPMVQG